MSDAPLMPPETPDPDRVATAYHEAGHAVVALTLDRPVVKVSILPNRDRAGHLPLRQGRHPAHRGLDRARDADRPGRDGRRGPAHGHLRPRGRRARLLRPRAVHGAERQRTAGRTPGAADAARVENLLDGDDVWLAVERIAAELLVRGEISGRQARHLYEECVRER